MEAEEKRTQQLEKQGPHLTSNQAPKKKSSDKPIRVHSQLEVYQVRLDPWTDPLKLAGIAYLRPKSSY